MYEIVKCRPQTGAHSAHVWDVIRAGPGRRQVVAGIIACNGKAASAIAHAILDGRPAVSIAPESA